MYYLWMKEKGRGCDYMIACGQKLVPLTATEPEAVFAEVMRVLEDHGSAYHDSGHILSRILILADSGLSINLDDLYRASLLRRQEEDRQKAEAKERTELERLQAKYSQPALKENQ